MSNFLILTTDYRRTLLFSLLLLLSIPAWLANTLPNYERLLQLAHQRYGTQGQQAVIQWQRVIASTHLNQQENLTLVNQFFNHRILFDSDLKIWNNPDYWATPLQTLGRGQGDCEDFSIAKYMTLLAMGVPPEKLRLVYVKATLGGVNSRVQQAHMVVAYYATPNSDPLILDNLMDAILPASQRHDLKPVYSFNSAGLWVGGANQAIIKKPEQRLSRWRDALARMHDEGL